MLSRRFAYICRLSKKALTWLIVHFMRELTSCRVVLSNSLVTYVEHIVHFMRTDILSRRLIY